MVQWRICIRQRSLASLYFRQWLIERIMGGQLVIGAAQYSVTGDIPREVNLSFYRYGLRLNVCLIVA